MRVSIITVCFNSAKTIEDTIQSVLSQDYPEIEYIIIDGASKDRTPESIATYRERISVYLSEPDAGIYDAMNKGIARATGDIIGILNSDDVYSSPSSVSTIVNAMISKGLDCAFSDLVVVDSPQSNKVLRYYNSGQFNIERFKYGWMPAHPTFFVKASIYKKVGPYALDYKISADYEMLIRILWVQRASYVYLPIPLVKMRWGGVSTSSFRQILLLNQEIVRACKANGINTNLFLLMLKIPRKILERFRPQAKISAT